jgi:1,2-diacylglycerol-3-alpha-glucose alpha-1,2-glucosyltransferase
MKVLLYFEGMKYIKKSGVGRALKHQMKALESQGIEYTLDPKDSFDIAHINTYGIKSSRLLKRCKKQGIPVVYHAHTTYEDFRNSFILSNQIAPLLKKRLTRLYGSADYVITPTPYSKSLIENYGVKTPIIAISNGIQLELFKKDEEKGKEFRKEYGFSDDDVIIMSIGLYIERKGILDFVEVAKMNPDYKFIWFGYTPLYSIPKKIRDIVKNPPKNVYFPGYVPSTTIAGSLSTADAFLFMTHEETEGIVVLEALATETPIVIRDIPVYYEWLEHGKNCYKCKTNEEFSNTLRKLVNKELPDLTKEGRKIAEERKIEKIGEKLLDVYEKVLNKKY